MNKAGEIRRSGAAVPVPAGLLPTALLLAAPLLGALSGCQEKQEWSGPPPLASGPLEPASADRLPPGKLLESAETAFGFPIPVGMKVVGQTPTTIRIGGKIDFHDLTDYVRDRIDVRHAEMLENRLIFPNARIKGDPKRVFEFSVFNRGKDSLLMIADTTPVVRPDTRGLTEAQRWEQAGLKPDGSLSDPRNAE